MNVVNKKNLVFVITKSEIGGAQKWVSEQKILLEDYFNIFLLTSDKGWLTEKFKDEQTIIIPGLKDVKQISNVVSVANALKRVKADIVVSSSANAGLYSRLSKLLWKHRSIYVSHGWSCIYNGGRAQKIYCLIERFLSFVSDSVLCVSANDKRNAMDIIGIKENKLSLIKNATFPSNVEKHNGHSGGKLKLVFVGRMTHPKRPELLADVISARDDVEAYFIGGGEYLEILKKHYDNNENIFFLGEVSDFSNYGLYDVFVLVSESEGLPMSAIEAGVAGLPLLLSDVGGCSELICENNIGKNGIVFKNSIQEISLAIDEMKSNYEKYASAASNLVDRFDLNSIKKDYIRLYEG